MAFPFPADVVKSAKKAQQVFGVPACLSLAQWALESEYGRKVLPGFNCFGMKAHDGEPGEWHVTMEYDQHGHSYVTRARFRTFASLEDAFMQHARYLAEDPHYSAARAHMSNPLAFAVAVGRIYATAPTYGNTLVKIIQTYNLTAIDGEAIQTI